MSIEERARELVAMWLASQEMATFSEWVPAAATMKLIGDVAAALREASGEDRLAKVLAKAEAAYEDGELEQGALFAIREWVK